jgi:poly(3-hydroxybutyrate) depolymerase
MVRRVLHSGEHLLDSMNVARSLFLLLLANLSFAVTDLKVDFTLDTADPYGVSLQQHRYYYLYRPDNLPRVTPIPIILLLEASPNSGPATFFHFMADQAGFVLVSCSFSGNSTGTPGTQWNADNPRITGFEDYVYLREVIRRVSGSENSVDAFVTGISKGGHMTMAYACERPSTVRAVGPLDEFMGLTSNLPTAPIPLIMFQGTLDTNVPYTMVKDTVDVWRAVNGLLNVAPVTTYESSPLTPGSVSRATWSGGTGGSALAFVTVIGGTHTYPTPTVQTGYDYTAGVWAFFSEFLTAPQTLPKILSQPVDNIQPSGMPATFRIAAAGAAPMSYQWQRNGVDIPGATSSSFTLLSATAADDGVAFRAVATNQFGSVTSAAAKLSVRAAAAGPTISAQPEDLAVTAGQPVRFTIAAQGASPLSYQWRKNGLNIAGATAASYSLPAAISSDCGANFSVVVTDAVGSTTSNRATLTVTPAAAAPVIIVNPVRVRLLPGQIGSFSVVAWGKSPITYQWQKGRFTSNMADIPGATGAIYTIPAATLDDHLTLFRCVVSNAAGNATSASEMLFVTAALTAPTQITSAITASAQVGAPFQYTITSSPVCPDGESVHDRPEAVFSATIGRQTVANPKRESRRTGRVLARGGRQSGAINSPQSVLSGTDSAGILVCGRQESCAYIDDSGTPATICWRASTARVTVWRRARGLAMVTATPMLEVSHSMIEAEIGWKGICL